MTCGAWLDCTPSAACAARENFVSTLEFYETSYGVHCERFTVGLPRLPRVRARTPSSPPIAHKLRSCDLPCVCVESFILSNRRAAIRCKVQLTNPVPLPTMDSSYCHCIRSREQCAPCGRWATMQFWRMAENFIPCFCPTCHRLCRTVRSPHSH